MKLFARIRMYSLRAIFVLPLSFGLTAAVASAAAPIATTTLDVCQDSISGKWMYSGVVAIAGASLRDSSVLGINFNIENKTSSLGYVDALRVDRLADDPAATGPARVARFASEAPPLLLGTLRTAVQVKIYDPLAPASVPLRLAAYFDVTTAVCGCPKPTGCTRTQGYWKSKPGVVWPAPYSRTAMFFSSGLTWQQILDTPPKGGNGYLILAHQYIAAVLNRASDASAPSGVQSVIDSARTYFQGGSTPGSCGGSDCETQKSWAGILDTYNNGQYPGAPRHCPD